MRDRGDVEAEEKIRFSSAVLPKWGRRTKSLDALLPVLYLRGVSTVIKNPRIGLLAPARRTWAWLSHGGAPLFFGRLVGVPSNINLNAVTLDFIGRPVDYAAQKAALAASLRVLPYYDPVFITPDAQTDPDTVLEARLAMWHIDRTTLAVTTSHTCRYVLTSRPQPSIQLPRTVAVTRSISASSPPSNPTASSTVLRVIERLGQRIPPNL